jgi:hypothetical protein
MLVAAAAVCLGGWLIMTKLSRAVIACISATMMLPAAASIAGADTFTYELNGSYAESNGGPSLVPYGGTLGQTGYTFGVQQGLSLSGTGIFDVYSIDIQFYFDDINASPNGFERILEFKNLLTRACTIRMVFLFSLSLATPIPLVLVQSSRRVRLPTCW